MVYHFFHVLLGNLERPNFVLVGVLSAESVQTPSPQIDGSSKLDSGLKSLRLLTAAAAEHPSKLVSEPAERENPRCYHRVIAVVLW
jgi:hypothetical protein